MDAAKVTIIYSEGSEEVIECYDLGVSAKFLMLFDSSERPFRMINNALVDEVFIEQPDEDGFDIDFEPDLDRTIN